MGGGLSWIKAEVLGMVVAATLFGQTLEEKSMTDKALISLVGASANEMAQGP
jgi:ferritin-like metal-binding protein YciE